MLLCNIVFAPLSSAPGAKKTQEKIGGGGGGGGGGGLSRTKSGHDDNVCVCSRITELLHSGYL